MKVYKRGIISYIYSIVIGIIGIVFAYIIIRSLVSNTVSIVVTSILFLIMAYMTIISENIKFIIQDDRLIYYQNNKEIYNINLKEVENVSYKQVMRSGSISTLDLYIDDKTIDCVALGRTKFNKLYYDILEIIPKKGIKIKTKKKEEDYEL